MITTSMCIGARRTSPWWVLKWKESIGMCQSLSGYSSDTLPVLVPMRDSETVFFSSVFYASDLQVL